MRSRLLLLPFVLVSLSLAAAQPAVTTDLPSPAELGRLWDRTRLALPLPPLLRHTDVVAAIQAAHQSAPDLFRSEVVGESVEGRSINHVWFGRGPLHVLLWSQMHGDEPTATVALFDVLHYIQANRTAPHVARMLDRLTLHVVPMLNPDGAEQPQRRNAQGIDINRDALLLQTPEGRALKALRDRVNPPIGFNLHNQNWRTSVGNTGKPAAMSLLAVSFDEARSDNPGRILAKKVASVIRDAVEPLAPGMIARYDDEFEVRAFGDNLAKWGTSVVLIETGPYPGSDPDRALVRMNVVALLTSLDALASGRVDGADPARYEMLPFNSSNLLHTIVSHAAIAPGTGVAPFLGDIGIAGSRVVREVDGQREVGFSAKIEELGDLRVFGALETIDATGLTAAPLWDKQWKVGDEVALPLGRGGGPVIAPGQPAAIALLRPRADGKYVVERIVNVK
jgi:Zinc carboxypeptidase